MSNEWYMAYNDNTAAAPQGAPKLWNDAVTVAAAAAGVQSCYVPLYPHLPGTLIPLNPYVDDRGWQLVPYASSPGSETLTWPAYDAQIVALEARVGDLEAQVRKLKRRRRRHAHRAAHGQP